MQADDKNVTATMNRRLFLSAAATCAGGIGAGLAAATSADAISATARLTLADLTIARTRHLTSEQYWLNVKKLFLLKPGLIALNAANLCPSSQPVSDKLFNRTRDIDSDPSFENRVKYTNSTQKTRQLLADMLGCDVDEIAITRNTSESNHAVIRGLDLKAGDEVLLWDQNHESNNIAWDVWSRRLGFSVKRVSIPDAPKDSETLLNTFVNAINKRTKLLSFSHVSNISGVALPAKALCEAARGQGLLSLVDGAQTFGMSVQNLHAMGCDFYTGSAHKWLCGPRETGVLYARRDAQSHVWPPMVGHGWNNASQQGAQKLDNLGQRDDGRIEALGTAVEFYKAVGGERVESRIRSHTRHLIDGFKPLSHQATGPLKIITPLSDQLRGGMVVFLQSGKKALPTMDMLYQQFGISAMAADVGQQTLVRFAPHIYNSTDDIETAIRAVYQLVKA